MSKVCLCKGITEEEIIKAIKEGATSYEQVQETTSAGKGCCRGARCKGKINTLIEENK
ncbi:bacterioferritin-associated ferredoxin [Clostridium collagenovorans DSM 3089]|uniref:Bacterioferritin-associated ferredoxin n=1 Tax=Clostridium collagenovorans DSM 3089 TaxID=1121306 RepID=A0A1M5U9J7_9CLOT|nr:(2Fe-2S)-binding protein [Clostridium collagenovorans]SHH59600.1 bacterioferritin-associated ferredoxin [Clostridium collagenovorans DSM 3089]